MFEPGLYRARLLSHTLGENDKGTLELRLPFNVLGVYDEAGELQESEDRPERTLYLYLTPATIGTAEQPGHAARQLHQLGFDDEILDRLDHNRPDAHDFVGQEVDLVCKHEDYNGKTKERWSLKGERRELAAADKSAFAALNGHWRGASRTIAKTKPKPKQETLPI